MKVYCLQHARAERGCIYDLVLVSKCGKGPILVETYGIDTVMDNLDKNLMTMSKTVYGKEFSEIYKDFTVWINEAYESYAKGSSDTGN